MESVVQLIQNVLPWYKQRTCSRAALLLQGLWYVVTVAAAAIIVAIEATGTMCAPAEMGGSDEICTQLRAAVDCLLATRSRSRLVRSIL
jgi:hypothetical protein